MNWIQLIQKYGFRRYRIYRLYYKMKQKGNVTDHFTRVAMFCDYSHMNRIERLEMKSGKIGIYKIFDLTEISSEWESENIRRDFIGYEGIKPIRECTLAEFMELYYDFLKV